MNDRKMIFGRRFIQLALFILAMGDPLSAQEVSPATDLDGRGSSPEIDSGCDSFTIRVVRAAKERTLHEITYNGSYFPISYPNGDIPEHFGVCTDLVIRVFRKAGVDLQQKVHEDMAENFNLYPSGRIWGLNRPDSNIDHRRVPNLQVFFERSGVSLEITRDAEDYLPGDLVTWMLPGNLPHIGIVIDERASDGGRFLIAHNIGEGPKINDILFDYPITGHYRWRKTG